jgi:hypothetical protein
MYSSSPLSEVFPVMPRPIISYGTRKALEVQLGEDAGREIVAVLQQLTEAVAALEKRKVDVTQVVPAGSPLVPSAARVLSEEFHPQFE